ncbi:DUF4333 domain-containing protein [Streptomyces sp. P01-B04]|uniref:DUF4333 domain-containing protein n=1 Tax=Streptomyces poriferorum TaxID=2798799 RepID=UPI001C5EEBCC|nr:DUF4333 domain-containing protein [Streptomyces poriferorum]MBW5250463.1 DUF4333 domain-containing protein [Streptomyces poriferorum]MBW5258910.1 DUF4333 domain-containing protein [Streptomyces poriferorum]
MQQSTGSRIAVRAAGALLAVAFAAGCSASVGSKEVSKDEVAKQASAALGKQVGREPDDVTCEDDLKAEVGATIRCELTDGGTKQGMTVTAKSVDGDKVKMDFKVDEAAGAGSSADEPTDAASTGTDTGGQSVNRAEVARQGKAALTAQVGKAPDAFSCAEDLPAEVGATIRCQLASEGKQYGVTVTAKSVVNGKVSMDFKVDDAATG